LHEWIAVFKRRGPQRKTPEPESPPKKKGKKWGRPPPAELNYGSGTLPPD